VEFLISIHCCTFSTEANVFTFTISSNSSVPTSGTDYMCTCDVNRDKNGTIFEKRDIIASRGNMKIYRDIVLKNGTVSGKPGRLVTLY
jgi:hypothetical protein